MRRLRWTDWRRRSKGCARGANGLKLQYGSQCERIASAIRVARANAEELRRWVVPPGLRSFLSAFPALKSVRENSAVPPGLGPFFPLFPALKGRAIIVRPSGAGFSDVAHHCVTSELVLTHTLKRWAKFGRPSGAGFPANPFHLVAGKRVLTHTPKRWKFGSDLGLDLTGLLFDLGELSGGCVHGHSQLGGFAVCAVDYVPQQ